jgi:DNA-binding MarR family transcriptional regulator
LEYNKINSKFEIVVQKLHNLYNKHMIEPTSQLRHYFSRLQLEPEIADLYLALHAHGPQTISELARTSGVERTRIYRLMDELAASNLIEVETEAKRSLIKAAPIGNVRLLISRQEQELKGLQSELEAMEQLFAPTDLSSPATRVQFYRGPEGVKQMFWNQTRARGETTSILHKNMQMSTQDNFFERWVEVCNRRNQHFRGIIGDNFIASQQQWYSRRQNERLRNWRARYVNTATFRITHGLTIYDDITSYFNWKDGEVFGIEIHNAEITTTQRGLFELLWQQARPVDDLTGRLT